MREIYKERAKEREEKREGMREKERERVKRICQHLPFQYTAPSIHHQWFHCCESVKVLWCQGSGGLGFRVSAQEVDRDDNTSCSSSSPHHKVINKSANSIKIANRVGGCWEGCVGVLGCVICR